MEEENIKELKELKEEKYQKKLEEQTINIK